MFNVHSLFVIVLLVSSPSTADEDDEDEGLTVNPVSDSGAVRSVCKPVPNTMSLCSGIGYGEMRLPNLLGHDTAREAQQQSASWLPLLGKHCHRDTRRFLCSLFAPVCLPEVPVPVRPCRSLCEAVRDACLPVMSAFGFPWPEMFNCSRFPDGPELCVPGERDANPEETTTDAHNGSVVCEVCSPDSGEREIQQNFCKSPFAFRLRIGSWSRDGSDVRVVPQGRSRVLRWQDHQVAAGDQSALWLPGGRDCSCPALDGPLTGSYIALAHMTSGRMLVSRLLKWSREEKELKKFIRMMLRRAC
ncbi:secreted frizzled-related protein 2-like [Rhinichthys klamathensis goyatoka]|uniref:secreted frizzled-related protein 2-like n=1 Tax=Rhinichthys klamathensis goyatoka TaxID=3034132 RepID=UPI0024B5ECF7|nr:secreted frizzled-related protein 2-like [Rhinichthys klamathensis goyatoka]